MNILTQDYLLNHSLSDLETEHAVFASPSKCKTKISLNYDQISANENDPIAKECRGLILRIDPSCIDDKTKNVGQTQIVAFPFTRFFNHGQGCAANVDFNSISVTEKLDGTLIILYFDHLTDCWHTATRSVPEANIEITGFSYTFRTLFEKALRDSLNLSFDEFTKNLDKSNTYCFELTSPYNQVVVRYENTSITLLMIRNNQTKLEYDIYSYDINCPKVMKYNLNILQNILDYVSSVNPVQHEGVVVYDSKFNRVKIKNMNYIAFSKIRDSVGKSDRNLVELILNEKDDDAEPFLPKEIVQRMHDYKTKISSLFHQYDELFHEVKSSIPSDSPNPKKEFAIKITTKNVWSAPFFKMFDGKCKNMKDFFAQNKSFDGWSNQMIDSLLDRIT